MIPYINLPFELTISSYNFFFMAGIYIGVIIFYLEVKRKKWDIENLMFSMSGCFLGAMIGAIFFNTILFGSSNTIEKIGTLNIEGMSVLGGILGGFIGVEIFKKIVGHKDSTGDAFAIAIPIGHAIGRIGCFLSGCCFGKVCDLPWAATYPLNSIPFLIHKNANLLSETATTSLAIHPIPIYEIIFNVILFIILIKIRDYFTVNGALFRFYIFSYCVFRFFEEFLRADTGDSFFLGLKIIQINLIISIGLIVYWFRKNEFREA